MGTDIAANGNLMPYLITRRMVGHAAHSGYDRLAEFIPGVVIHPVNEPSLMQRVLGRTLRSMIWRSGSLWYHRDSFLSEFEASYRWYLCKGKVFHFLYGENSYRYLGELRSRNRRNIIVCTYHTPPTKFCSVVKDRNHIGKVDGIIVVSSAQADFFTDIVGPQRVFYVPHGVDVDYFRPATGSRRNAKEKILLVFVGTHLRDFETLAGAARLLNDQGVAFHLKVVTHPRFYGYFRGIDNIECYAGISDSELLRLYQEAHVLVIPFLDCTANNSLLEGMACGLPVVCPDLRGARDYASEKCTIFTAAKDPYAVAAAVVRLQADESLLQKMSLASRRRGMEFSWPTIASKIMGVYNQLITTG